MTWIWKTCYVCLLGFFFEFFPVWERNDDISKKKYRLLLWHLHPLNFNQLKDYFLSWNIWVIKLYCCVYQKGKTKPVRPMFLCTKCLRKKVLQWIPLPPCITACTCCVSHWIHFIAVIAPWCNDGVNARIVGLPLRSLGPKIKDPCVARSTLGAESELRIQVAKL